MTRIDTSRTRRRLPGSGLAALAVITALTAAPVTAAAAPVTAAASTSTDPARATALDHTSPAGHAGHSRGPGGAVRGDAG